MYVAHNIRSVIVCVALEMNTLHYENKSQRKMLNNWYPNKDPWGILNKTFF